MRRTNTTKPHGPLQIDEDVCEQHTWSIFLLKTLQHGLYCPTWTSISVRGGKMLCEYTGTEIPEHRPLRTDQPRHGRAGVQNCCMHCTCIRDLMHVNRMFKVLKGRVTDATRLLTATNDMKGSCATFNMEIHDTCDVNDKMMRAGFVFRCQLCDRGELIRRHIVPGCIRSESIRISDIQQPSA